MSNVCSVENNKADTETHKADVVLSIDGPFFAASYYAECSNPHCHAVASGMILPRPPNASDVCWCCGYRLLAPKQGESR